MGTVLPFRAADHRRPDDEQRQAGACEIVIFPGVRIERHGIQAVAADEPPTGHDNYDGTHGRPRRRKTS